MYKLLACFGLVLQLVSVGLVYPATMQVTDISGDVVTIENATGFQYQFNGAEDYCKGDLVSLVMWSNGTDNITDDIILAARYSGYYFK